MHFSEITRVTQDSREVKKGDYFVACVGENVDGHVFIDQALENGAAGVLEEEELYGLAKEKLQAFAPTVVAITGSVGKTTTKEAITAVLGEEYTVVKSPENINTRRGLSLFILNKLSKDCEVLVVEIGMDRFGEIAETCQTIPPNFAVLTSISETHLEKLGSLERIKETKAGILDALPLESVAVLNGNDEQVVDVSDRAPGKIVWFGLVAEESLHPFYSACEIEISRSGTEFAIFENGRKLGNATMQILGKAAVYSGTAAAAIGKELKLSFRQIADGLVSLKPAPHRLNLIQTGSGTTILDDSYNASDVSTLAALDVFSRLEADRRIAVLGDMLELGSHEQLAHQRVGKEVATVADVLVTVGDLGEIIGKTAEKQGLEKVFYAQDAGASLKILRKKVGLKKGDLVLVKASHSVGLDEVARELVTC
ncbi:MAG: UDP-N-acetylmuramoyl-tripeptide--D-alanyl-D-alanine ligase [Patescibacteria group bacterium]